MAKHAVIDLRGRTCIVLPGIDVDKKHWHRRGVIIRSLYRYGQSQHLVNLESRGFEDNCATVWIPQLSLIHRTPKNEQTLSYKLRGNDDAKLEDPQIEAQ